MSPNPKLSAEDFALLRLTYIEGAIRIVESEALSVPFNRAFELEKAGLMRSIQGISEQDGRCRYFALSGAGIARIV